MGSEIILGYYNVMEVESNLIKGIEKEVRPVIINKVNIMLENTIKETIKEYIESFSAMLLSQDKFKELWDNKQDSIWDNV